MAASMTDRTPDRKLPELFDDIWKIYEYLDTTDEGTTSDVVQTKVKDGVSDAEMAVHMVNMLQLYSDNENIAEVKTNELKFLLLPALLAFFTNKNCKEERSDVIKKVQLYYKDFLKLCKNYEVSDVIIPSVLVESGDDSTVATRRATNQQSTTMNQRQAKVARYKEQKETEQRLKELYPQVQREHVDDEVKRDYFHILLKRWVNHSVDELESIESELPILEHMAKMKKGGLDKDAANSSKITQPKQPMRPFILTRDAAQKQVYGLGYPSIPTYSLEEYFENQVQQGILPEQGIPAGGATADDPDREAREKEKSDQEKEDKVEQDDEEALKKARDWDEWKDDHRRGWGNMHNKG